jgi:hypothetical protein
MVRNHGVLLTLSELRFYHLSNDQMWLTGRAEIRRIKFAKTGRVAEVLEHLPSKCEGLSSNPGTAKRKKKKNVSGDGNFP